MVCEIEECKKRSIFGPKDGKNIRCSIHKLSTDVRIYGVCFIKDCYVVGQYRGLICGKLYCSKHKPDKLKKGYKLCVYKNCTIRGEFVGVECNKKYCITHKPLNFIKSKSICAHNGCYTHSRFTCLEGKRFCSRHRPNKVKKTNRVCSYVGCYGSSIHTSTNGLRYCHTHKPCDILKSSRMCCMCKSSGMFRDISGKKYCKKHKPDVVTKARRICLHPGCDLYGGYVLNNIHYCTKHKPSGAKNPSKRCISYGCNTYPQFGIDIGKPTHCKHHKTANMKNVKGRRCTINNCTKRARYNYKSIKIPIRCTAHKENDMTFSYSRICKFEKCLTSATFNYKGKKPILCAIHKKSNMIDVKSPRCKKCGLFLVSNIHKMCSYCNPQTFSKKKTKENTVIKYLNVSIDKSFVSDKKVGWGTCGKYRPDVLYDCNTHFIIVEIDEHQHKQYDTVCEITRMIHIQESLGMNTVFIRYNPDTFKIRGKINKQFSTELRLYALNEAINYYFVNAPMNKLTVKKLFYNCDTLSQFINNWDIHNDLYNI
jgi:hypothetical protein